MSLLIDVIWYQNGLTVNLKPEGVIPAESGRPLCLFAENIAPFFLTFSLDPHRGD